MMASRSIFWNFLNSTRPAITSEGTTSRSRKKSDRSLAMSVKEFWNKRSTNVGIKVSLIHYKDQQTSFLWPWNRVDTQKHDFIMSVHEISALQLNLWPNNFFWLSSYYFAIIWVQALYNWFRNEINLSSPRQRRVFMFSPNVSSNFMFSISFLFSSFFLYFFLKSVIYFSIWIVQLFPNGCEY